MAVHDHDGLLSDRGREANEEILRHTRDMMSRTRSAPSMETRAQHDTEFGVSNPHTPCVSIPTHPNSIRNAHGRPVSPPRTATGELWNPGMVTFREDASQAPEVPERNEALQAPNVSAIQFATPQGNPTQSIPRRYSYGEAMAGKLDGSHVEVEFDNDGRIQAVHKRDARHNRTASNVGRPATRPIARSIGNS